MNFLQLLDLPQIPSNIIDQIKFEANTPPEGNKILYDSSYSKFGEKYANYGYSSFYAGELIQQWSNSVFPGFGRASVNKIMAGGALVAHTDIDRQMALNYIVETGGPSVYTRFLKFKDDPKVLHNYYIDINSIITSELTLVEEYCLPQHSWAILRTDCIHDVTYVDSDRILFSIDLTESDFDRLLEKFNIPSKIIRNPGQVYISWEGKII